MKSLEEQLMIEHDKYVADQKKKGFNDGAIATVWKESVNGASVEERLSRAKKLNSKNGISESAPINEAKPVTRNNGGSRQITETSVSRDERILHFMADSRFSYREACYMAGERPEAGVKQPESITETIIARWKKNSPWLSTKDARTLAEMGKLP